MSEDIGVFHGAQINFADEYHEARRLMGLRTTDLDLLFEKVALLYVNTNDKWEDPFHNLMWEIYDRQQLTLSL